MSHLDQRLEQHRATHPTRTAPLPEGDFHYTIGGRGSQTVVVLHGGGSTAEATHPFCIALEADFRVLAIDWPATAHTTDDVVSGIDAVLAVEGVRRASLLGFSMGGMLAQRWARAHPESIDGLILYASMGPSERYAKRFARARRILSLVPQGLLLAASRRAVVRWATEAAVDDPTAAAFIAAQRRWGFDAGKVTKATLLSDADILVDFFGGAAPAADVSCPVLIVEAARDRMVDGLERAALKASYPNARVVTLADTDHFAGVLAPPSIVAELRGFLLAAAATVSH